MDDAPAVVWPVVLLVIVGVMLYGWQLVFDAVSIAVDERIDHYVGVFLGP